MASELGKRFREGLAAAIRLPDDYDDYVNAQQGKKDLNTSTQENNKRSSDLERMLWRKYEDLGDQISRLQGQVSGADYDVKDSLKRRVNDLYDERRRIGEEWQKVKSSQN